MRHGFVQSLIRHGSNQAIVQLILFGVGILIVRSLTKDQYAAYAVVTATYAAFGVLTDAGVNAVVMAEGAKRLHDRQQMSVLMASARRARTVIGAILVGVTLVWLGVLLSTLGIDASEITAILVVSIVALVPIPYASLLQTYLRLDYRLGFVRAVNLGSALVRLAIIGVASVFGIGNAVVFLALIAMVNVGTWIAFSSEVRGGLERRVAIDSGLLSALQGSVLRTLPSVAVLVLFEQLFTLAVSSLGGAAVVAEFSAMARFGVAFVVVNAIVVDVVAPRFARTAAEPALLFRRFGLAGAAYLGIVGTFIIVVALASNLLLALLGPEYRGLNAALVVISAGFGIANLAQMMNALNVARGWIRWSWIYLPLMCTWAACGLLFFDLSNINDVAIVFVLQWVPAVIMQAARAVAGFLETRGRT